MFDSSCIKSDVCDMAICDGVECKHRAPTGGSANTSINTGSPKLPTLKECYAAIPIPTDARGAAMFAAGIAECHKFIVGRQLRASA